MEIKKTIWHTKQTCPDCEQGHPVFCFCTKCGFVTLVCDETGDTFINPKNLKEGFTKICPNCKEEDTYNFEIADSDNIINAGFTKEDYE